MSEELWQLSAGELAAAIAARRIGCVEVMQAHLARIEAVNGVLNAITVRRDEAALADAEAADRALARGQRLGPLHGVPVTIKENVDVAGEATPNGIPAFKDLIASEDSPPVANLKRAGGIVLGRTNTPEFSIRWHTDNPLRGQTFNPWHRGITPGGSSGGAGAALAAGLGPLAHGNDLGGSLRYPAYCCGIATIRPTLGRVPAAASTATSERPPSIQLMSVQGPMARTIADVRLGLAAMAQADPRDPWWVPAPLQGPPPERPIKVAVSIDPAGGGVDPSVADAVRAAADALADAGYDVAEVEPPAVEEIKVLWQYLLNSDLRQLMLADIDKYGSEDIRTIARQYLDLSPELDITGYMQALARRAGYLRQWMLFLRDRPLVLGPVSCEPPLGVGDDTAGPARIRAIQDAQRLLVAVNLLGLPAAAVPTRLVDGVPRGVQVIAARYREDLALDAAEAIERALAPKTPIDPRE